MIKFEVIQPSEKLTPYIKQYWCLTMDNTGVGFQRLIPFGSVVLSFSKTSKPSYINNTSIKGSYLSGQFSSHQNLVYPKNVNFISVVFQPTGAMAFFKIPMNELYNNHVSIEELDDSLLKELEKHLQETNNKESIELIETFLIKRFSDKKYYDHKRLSASIEAVSSNNKNVSHLAKISCLSYKQYKRIFIENIGINPKEYIRINRLQTALYILQKHPNIILEQVAEYCEFTDKSHLIKEFRVFTGYSPSEYLTLCDPYSEYHALFRSAFLDSPIIT